MAPLLWMLGLHYHSLALAVFGEVAVGKERTELLVEFKMFECWRNKRNDGITIS